MKECYYCNKMLSEKHVKTEDIIEIKWICENDHCDFAHEVIYEERGLVLDSTRTYRGFKLFKFKDRYNEECTLQMSSLATESAIWFGTSGRVKRGPPWREYKLPDDAMVSSRMHLTQQQVKKLLPILIHFSETGELPDEA